MNAEWEDEYLSISMCPDLMGRALWICAGPCGLTMAVYGRWIVESGVAATPMESMTATDTVVSAHQSIDLECGSDITLVIDSRDGGEDRTASATRQLA